MPAVHRMGIYVLVSWQYSYSFPIYMTIAYTHKRIVDAIIEISDLAKEKN